MPISVWMVCMISLSFPDWAGSSLLPLLPPTIAEGRSANSIIVTLFGFDCPFRKGAEIDVFAGYCYAFSP